jgi:Protein of unknown function (DUF4238)
MSQPSETRTRQKKKGKDPRKHHYVPVFYQKHFANADELLWVYDRQRRTFKELHPLVICFKKDLYALKPEDEPRDPRIENKVLALVDALGASGIRDFQNGKVSRDAEEAVAFFMSFQYNRVPTISRDIRATYAKLVEEFGRISFANVERAKAVLEKIARDTGEPVTVTPESMVEWVQGKHFEIVATEATFLRNMMEQSVTLSRLLGTLDWEILVASDETGFILCDCPVVVVPPKGSAHVGFLIPGSAKYFPLTRSLCLRLGGPGRSRRSRKIDKEAVRIVNQNIAANSERFIMGPSRVQLENVVSRSGTAAMEDTPRLIVETVESDDNSALQMLVAQPRRYFYGKDGSRFAP